MHQRYRHHVGASLMRLWDAEIYRVTTVQACAAPSYSPCNPFSPVSPLRPGTEGKVAAMQQDPSGVVQGSQAGCPHVTNPLRTRGLPWTQGAVATIAPSATSLAPA